MEQKQGLRNFSVNIKPVIMKCREGMRHTIELGKVDFNHNGKRNCMAELEWELTGDGRFTMSGNIWNHLHTDIYCGGQCVDEVVDLFPHNKKAQRMLEIWKRWHLNDAQAGCEHQRSLGWVNYNEHPSEPCPVCGYKYGTAWLKEEIPETIKAEIRSW